MTIDTFAIWAPMSLSKARPNGGDSEPMVGRIGGIVSSETLDQQSETLDQDGVDWSYFLDKGWFNYEHQSGPDNVLGHPERVTRIDHGGKPATRVEGVLYLAKARAKEIYETAQAMAKAGGGRRLGFSVEGQVVERDAKDKTKIRKSKVLNVAITAHPVHPDARLEVLARSLMAVKSFPMGMAGVGYQTPADPFTGGSISPLVPQSIEGIPALATYGAAAMRRKRMTVQELALQLTTTYPQLSYAQAMSLATEMARAVR